MWNWGFISSQLPLKTGAEKISIMTFTITTLSITDRCHNAECHYTESHILLGATLSVVTISVFMLSVFTLSVFMLSVFILSVVMLIVVMLSVVAARKRARLKMNQKSRKMTNIAIRLCKATMEHFLWNEKKLFGPKMSSHQHWPHSVFKVRKSHFDHENFFIVFSTFFWSCTKTHFAKSEKREL